MANAEEDEPLSIAGFLAAERWKHALFTTYALSLSYFESELLRPLLQGGCDDIWLIADAEGYRASLLERRSMRVGQEYWLIPAALPNGVFHAKSIFLCNDEDDLLLVGSGNVTFGGHGRNAEVFEALTPDTDPVAFTDFADYLDVLGLRDDIQIARTEWIDDFAARARRAAERGSGEKSGARLVHCLEAPIAGQLSNIISESGTCHDAVIMSPYHDPEGQGVRALLDAVDSPVGKVAVQDRASPFPFEAAKGWQQRILPVRNSKGEARFVHAKWFEFDLADRRLLVTGSINATRQAVTTTNNVELGVYRWISRRLALIDWQETALPAYKKPTPLPPGLGQSELVYAYFDRADGSHLQGRLMSLQDMAGEWQGLLAQADGDSIAFEVVADQEGQFRVQNPDLEPFSQYPALQITLSRDGREARGWVHNDLLLSMGSRRRLTAGALSRLLRRDHTDDDIQALMDYFSIHAEQHLTLFSQRVSADEGDQDHRKLGAVRVHIDELQPSDEPLPELPHRFRSNSSSEDAFNSVMRQLRLMLLGDRRARAEALAGTDTVVAEEDTENDQGLPPEKQREVLGLEQFEHEMTRMLKEAQENQAVIAGILSMMLEVGMWVRLHRLNDRSDAHDFLQHWFYQACAHTHVAPRQITALQQHIYTSAAALIILTPEDQSRSIQAMAYHDALESLNGGTVEREHACRCLLPVETSYLPEIAGEERKWALEPALDEILDTPTRRQQLAEALALAQGGKPVPKDWMVFQSPLGNELRETLNGPHCERRVKAAPSGFTGCAFDYFKFPPDEDWQFRRERIGRCIHCKRFTLRLWP